MVISPRKRLTLRDFLRLPEDEPALEYHDGVISQKPMPKLQHSALQAMLVERFNRAWRRRKLAHAFPELRVTFGGHSCVPDVSVLRWDRIPADEAGQMLNDVREPPDIAVEIVSPEQGVNPLVSRCLWYVANGVLVALLVDPSDQSVMAFRPGTLPSPSHGSDRIDLDDVLPGFTLRVKELFGSLKIR